MTGGNHVITAALSSPHLRSGAPGLGSISHVAAQPFSQPFDHSGCGNTDTQKIVVHGERCNG